MNNPGDELKRLIVEALAPLTVNSVLPANAVLVVLDPVTGDWEHYAEGGTAGWFASILDEDAITEIYRRAMLVSHYGDVLVDYMW